jgi:hypothetical protein
LRLAQPLLARFVADIHQTSHSHRLYQPSEELTLFCKSTAAVILFCLTELIREIGDGRGGRATAGFRGG